jgi:hypothetical protein
MQREHHRELERTAGAPTRRGVLNWERLSNNKPCSASAYQLNSLVIAAGGDQAAMAPEGGPKYRLVGAGAPWPVPRRPEPTGRAQPAARRMPISPANCRTSSLLDSESSQLPPRARMKVHNSVTSLRSPPQTERPLARSTMLSVSATFMTKVVLSVSQYASRTSASASLVKTGCLGGSRPAN